MGPKRLILGLPKGSLQDMTFDIMEKAGFRLHLNPRSYQPLADDPELEVVLVRPQEIPRYVESGILDCGITGQDWVLENKAKVTEVQQLRYSKVSFRPVRWVLAVPESSRFRSSKDLKGASISTELVNVTRGYFRKKKIKVKEVEFSWGATEVKPPKFCDAIVEATETGSSLRANNLRIIDVVLESVSVLIANKQVYQKGFKFQKIQQIALLLEAVMNAKSKVVLKMNINDKKLSELLLLLPSLRGPTISKLSQPGWVAVESVVDQGKIRDLLPRLRKVGAQGILEFPLLKVLF